MEQCVENVKDCSLRLKILFQDTVIRKKVEITDSTC
jgi:hypothetical protein